jgi:hypothetical protein
VKIRLSPYLSLQGVLCLAAFGILEPSCSKSGQSITDGTCITRVIPKVTDYQVSGADLDSIYTLFKANNLSTVNLQFDYFVYAGPGEQVIAIQFINGLPA